MTCLAPHFSSNQAGPSGKDERPQIIRGLTRQLLYSKFRVLFHLIPGPQQETNCGSILTKLHTHNTFTSTG